MRFSWAVLGKGTLFLFMDLELCECKFWSCYKQLITMTDKSEMDERQKIKSRNET